MFVNYWPLYVYSFGSVLLPQCFTKVSATLAKDGSSPRMHPLIKWTYIIISFYLLLIVADVVTFALTLSEDTPEECKQFHGAFLALVFVTLLIAFSPSVMGLRKNEITQEFSPYPPALSPSTRRASQVARRAKKRSRRESVIPDDRASSQAPGMARQSVAGKRMSVAASGGSTSENYSVSTSVLYRDPTMPLRESNTLVQYVKRRMGQ